nr:syntaxin-123 isoform X3 [Arachis hypogaea]
MVLLHASEDAVDGEKSSAAAALAAAAAAAGRMKKSSVKSKSGPKTAWRKLLSQCSQKATKQPGTIMDTIQEIQGCHDTLIDIESSLNELHQVFLDMTVLVQSQGKQLNDIQSHESRANSYVCRGFGSFSLQGSTRRILEVHLHCHHNIDLLY